MGELFLQIRHPELDRLYTIWRLLCADSAPPSISAANPVLLCNWKDRLLIVEFEKMSGALREIHVGNGVADKEAACFETTRAAITEVAKGQRPVMVEEANPRGERRKVLILPFGAPDENIVRVVAAIYLAS